MHIASLAEYYLDKNHIADYEKVVNKVDLDSIRNRELKTRHDVKARIEEFNLLAQHEDIHKGLTSRDLTENVEQLQIKKSLELINLKTVAIHNGNLFEALMEAVKYCSLGQITHALYEVGGQYRRNM